ncbi:hypothetical protein ACTU3I_00670 [Microbacterium sp. RD1]|uniref:hypothetical protein n=1 Tax=Microbacterium sp. RD1 TaxID=3457313 RepID=UPI003FA607A3
MRRLPSIRVAAVTAVILAVALTGTACMTGSAGSSAADHSRIAESASRLGVAPELLYTTQMDGYDLAPQSVGPSGGDGMSATWFNDDTAATLTIRTDRGELNRERCETIPVEGADGAPVTCEDEDGVWHRSAGELHEYVAVRGDAYILVSGTGADAADLLAAAKAVHVPSDAELTALLSDAPTSAPTPVERGDLPENGDGAPIDPTGPGG